MILETERLILREMTQADFPLLCKHLQDAEVMYAYEHAFSDTEVQEGIDKQIQRYKEDGFGVWAVILKDNGELIGQCGLSMQPFADREVLEIGYIFQKAYWRKGYATEAATACKKYAFDVLNSDEVFSIIRDTNTASQNVAKRIGMTIADMTDIFVKHYQGIEMLHYLFSVKRSV
jgi:RimJ/RimL family protein N-acetyltransferase